MTGMVRNGQEWPFLTIPVRSWSATGLNLQKWQK